ncbi:MAG: T9SS type A sorting domain-containing protein [Bacteroidota bacterium]|nr:T9SS type A sorting domain-containing protein [Bacteroidota bacterium]
MKKLIITLAIIFYTVSCMAQGSNFNNWITVGGNNNRDCFNNNFFDFTFGNERTFNSPGSIWGMPIFTYNAYFATTRYTSLSPLRALIAGYTFSNTNPIWTYGENSGVNVIMGFNDSKVYARDFQQNGNDTIFALNANDGSLVWKSRHTVERGIIWTACFAQNGDLILPGSATKRIMRINHLNGDTVWTNNRIIPNTGAETMCINGNTLYAWEGSITTPKTIIAINLSNGIIKYASPTLPGDGDQEIPFSVSRNGIIYCIRDGGLMYALKDTGTGFDILWSRNVLHPVGTYTQFAISKDSSIYIPLGKKIYRLNHNTGAAMDSSIDLVTSGTINPRFAIGMNELVHVSNGANNPSEGKFFLFSKNLQTLHWELPYPYNYYCGPSFGNETTGPFLLMTGAGTEIKTKYTFIDNVNYESNSIPDKIELSQNYPNPFNPTTTIKYQITNHNFVELKVYNILGNEVAALVNEKQKAGIYSVEFDAGNYSSGVYLYKLIVGNSYIETKSMLLLK